MNPNTTFKFPNQNKNKQKYQCSTSENLGTYECI